MGDLILLFSLLHSIFCYVEAQSPSDQNKPPSGNATGNLKGVAAVIAVLFILSILLVLYFKFWRITTIVQTNQQIVNGSTRLNPRSSGIDTTVIESIPFFKFSCLRGLKGGLECTVCLSKFEEVEVLRLLPKCKHAFHINCIDQWLENHSSCPLCRQKIIMEDLTYSSDSLRLLVSQPEVMEDSNVEFFVQREDSRRLCSSRHRIGSSFRILGKGVGKEDELPLRKDCDVVDGNDKFLHKFNHKIIMSNGVIQTKVSGAALKSRWSNLSSSDLLFLNSEMLGEVSRNKFSPSNSSTQESLATQGSEEGGILKIKYKNASERGFETNSHPLTSGAVTCNPMRNLHMNENRSLSEIVVHSRFEEFNARSNSVKKSSLPKTAEKEERLKRLWLPIARKTLHSYANRDTKF